MYYMCVFNMWTSLVTQTVKNLPAVQETWVQSLDWKYPLEKEMAIHSSILAWRILWTEEPGRLQPTGSQELDTTQRLKHHYMSQGMRVALRSWKRQETDSPLKPPEEAALQPC